MNRSLSRYRKRRCFSAVAVLGVVAGLAHAEPGSEAARADLARYTEALSRFSDPAAASAAGYAHYDGYDTFSMGEHWYNRSVYESGTCNGERPSHLHYLNINGERRLIGTGYVCLPRDQRRPTAEVFDQSVAWHTHGPAWCLLPNGSNEDYRDLADALPNEVTNTTWTEACELNGGRAAVQPIRMLHTWNWIPAPEGVFSHENLAIPFLRVGLPVPDRDYLSSAASASTLQLLRLAHGDTQWWYWRRMTVAGATDPQKAAI